MAEGNAFNAAGKNRGPAVRGFKAELARKSLHALIALTPFLASVNRSNTALLLMGGTLFYAAAESLRFLGFFPPLISPITEAVLRKREKGRFVMAPITLGLGALLALLIFPPKAAAAAVYALAFGDSAAALVGAFLGRIRPAFMRGKSVEGSLACFFAAALPCFLIFGDAKTAAAVALAAVLADAPPLGDFDNLVLPLAAGLAALLFHG